MLGSSQRAHSGLQPRKNSHLHAPACTSLLGPGKRPLTLASMGHTAAMPSAAPSAALGPVPLATGPKASHVLEVATLGPAHLP